MNSLIFFADTNSQHYAGIINKGQYYNQAQYNPQHHTNLERSEARNIPNNAGKIAQNGGSGSSKIVVFSGVLLSIIFLVHFVLCFSYFRRSP